MVVSDVSEASRSRGPCLSRRARLPPRGSQAAMAGALTSSRWRAKTRRRLSEDSEEGESSYDTSYDASYDAAASDDAAEGAEDSRGPKAVAALVSRAPSLKGLPASSAPSKTYAAAQKAGAASVAADDSTYLDDAPESSYDEGEHSYDQTTDGVAHSIFKGGADDLLVSARPVADDVNALGAPVMGAPPAVDDSDIFTPILVVLFMLLVMQAVFKHKRSLLRAAAKVGPLRKPAMRMLMKLPQKVKTTDDAVSEVQWVNEEEEPVNDAEAALHDFDPDDEPQDEEDCGPSYRAEPSQRQARQDTQKTRGRAKPKVVESADLSRVYEEEAAEVEDVPEASIANYSEARSAAERPSRKGRHRGLEPGAHDAVATSSSSTSAMEARLAKLEQMLAAGGVIALDKLNTAPGGDGHARVNVAGDFIAAPRLPTGNGGQDESMTMVGLP
eukprot:5175478-Prymnesium_polylepis.1